MGKHQEKITLDQYQTQQEQKHKQLSMMDEFSAGAVSGAVSLIVGHPFDTLKTLQQSTSGRLDLLDLMRSMYIGGSNRFFRGLSVPLVSYSVVNSLYFGTYKSLLHWMDPTHTRMGAMALAGFMAGGVQLTICVPVEVIKINMQKEAAKDACPTLWQEMRKIYRQRGLRGFYAGSSAHAARDMPAGAIYFSSYTFFCEILTMRCRINSLVASFVAGAMAGCLSWVGTMPLDVMKTRLQGGTDRSIKQSFKALRALGTSAFFKGTSMVLVRALLVNATVFGVYEMCILFLRHRRSQPWTHYQQTISDTQLWDVVPPA